MKIQKHTTVPQRSQILEYPESFDYMDCYSTDIRNNNLSPDYLTAIVFASEPPEWVRLLSRIRDSVAGRFGLKTGVFSETEEPVASLRYKTGDTAGPFPVINRSDSEVLLGEDDSHLYFRVSVMTEESSEPGCQTVYVTTAVKFHNTLGRLYFLPVKPFHKLIVKSCLKRIGTQVENRNK